MTNLVATYSPSTTRSDNLQDCGFKFTYTGTTGYTVTQLGAWKTSGNTGTWNIRLRNGGGTANQTQYATGSISMAGGTAGQFNYVSVTAAALTNGSLYFLMAQIPSGQTYPDTSAITVNNANAVGGIYSVPDTLSGGGGSSFGTNNQYGGVDLVFGPAAPAGGTHFFFRSGQLLKPMLTGLAIAKIASLARNPTPSRRDFLLLRGKG